MLAKTELGHRRPAVFLGFKQLVEVKVDVVAPLLPPSRADEIPLLVLVHFQLELVDTACCPKRVGLYTKALKVLLAVIDFLLEAIQDHLSLLIWLQVFAIQTTYLVFVDGQDLWF